MDQAIVGAGPAGMDRLFEGIEGDDGKVGGVRLADGTTCRPTHYRVLVTSVVRMGAPDVGPRSSFPHYLPDERIGGDLTPACFKANDTCSSVYRDFFIFSSFLMIHHKAGKLSLNLDEKTGRTSSHVSSCPGVASNFETPQTSKHRMRQANLLQLVTPDNHMVNGVWAVCYSQRSSVCIHARQWRVLRYA